MRTAHLHLHVHVKHWTFDPFEQVSLPLPCTRDIQIIVHIQEEEEEEKEVVERYRAIEIWGRLLYSGVKLDGTEGGMMIF